MNQNLLPILSNSIWKKYGLSETTFVQNDNYSGQFNILSYGNDYLYLKIEYIETLLNKPLKLSLSSLTSTSGNAWVRIRSTDINDLDTELGNIYENTENLTSTFNIPNDAISLKFYIRLNNSVTENDTLTFTNLKLEDLIPTTTTDGDVVINKVLNSNLPTISDKVKQYFYFAKDGDVAKVYMSDNNGNLIPIVTSNNDNIYNKTEINSLLGGKSNLPIKGVFSGDILTRDSTYYRTYVTGGSFNIQNYPEGAATYSTIEFIPMHKNIVKCVWTNENISSDTPNAIKGAKFECLYNPITKSFLVDWYQIPDKKYIDNQLKLKANVNDIPIIINDLATGGIDKVSSAETVKLLKTLVDGKANESHTHTINDLPPYLSLGETSSTAYSGDRGRIAYDHSQSSHAYLPLTGGTITGDLTVTGNLTGTKTYNAVWNDYAELFEKDNIHKDYEEGYIISINPETGKYTYSTQPESKLLIGVVSNTYGHLLGGDKNKSMEENLQSFIPIGLSGRVNVYVKGKVSIGDLITSSDVQGVGMVSQSFSAGTIIGKALECKDFDEIGKVKILILNM